MKYSNLDEYGLNPKERAFCDYYLKSGNQTEAYMDAFEITDRKKAGNGGSRLMKKDEIKTYIAIVRNQISSERIATAEEVLEFYTEIMRDKNQITGDRLKAADSLGKRYALFTQKVEATVQGSANFVINILGEDEE